MILAEPKPLPGCGDCLPAAPGPTHISYQGQQWVLLHNGGLCNNCTPKRCISKQLHYKTPFSHNGNMKSLEFYENYITLLCLKKIKLFEKYYIN